MSQNVISIVDFFITSVLLCCADLSSRVPIVCGINLFHMNEQRFLLLWHDVRSKQPSVFLFPKVPREDAILVRRSPA